MALVPLRNNVVVGVELFSWNTLKMIFKSILGECYEIKEFVRARRGHQTFLLLGSLSGFMEKLGESVFPLKLSEHFSV